MDEKLILTDDNNNILNLSLTCPLCAVIDNCDKRGINILHFKLYDVPVTYLNEKHKYHKDTPIGYQYISLIVDPGAQIWNAYPSEIDVVSSYLIVYQNVLYDIKSSILNLPYINTIIDNLVSHNDPILPLLHNPIYISQINNYIASIHINGLQLNEYTYKHIGTISIFPDIDLNLINEENVYTLFRNIRTYLPQLVKINEECNIISIGTDITQLELKLLSSKYLLDYYNIPPTYICFKYNLFPVLSIYSNILIYEINKISKAQLPFSSMCPVPDDKFIEEYEAQKQILQIL